MNECTKFGEYYDFHEEWRMSLNRRNREEPMMDMPFVNADAFADNDPAVVPARTFLAQLP